MTEEIKIGNKIERGSEPSFGGQGGSDIKIAKFPDGYGGPGFFALTLDKAVGLARKNSLWPLPFATSCCGIEFMSTMASTYDLGRFGAERLSFSPRQADLLMVMGTIAKKMGPVLRHVYEHEIGELECLLGWDCSAWLAE